MLMTVAAAVSMTCRWRLQSQKWSAPSTLYCCGSRCHSSTRVWTSPRPTAAAAAAAVPCLTSLMFLWCLNTHQHARSIAAAPSTTTKPLSLSDASTVYTSYNNAVCMQYMAYAIVLWYYSIYTVSQKKCHSTFIHKFCKCWLIFQILSLSYFP